MDRKQTRITRLKKFYENARSIRNESVNCQIQAKIWHKRILEIGDKQFDWITVIPVEDPRDYGPRWLDLLKMVIFYGSKCSEKI